MAKRPTAEQVNQACQNAKISVEMEGLTITQAQEDRIKAVLRGDITWGEYLRVARESASNG